MHRQMRFVIGCHLFFVTQIVFAASEIVTVQSAAVTGVDKLKTEAALLTPLVETPLAKKFLLAVLSLPHLSARQLYRNKEKRQWFSVTAAEKLPQAERDALTEFPADEEFYYYTAYGSPLVYVRVLELAFRAGVRDIAGARVMDFGYGSVGQLRMMASLGADAVGVDPSDMLASLYNDASDQGNVTRAGGSVGSPGRVTLVHRRWPEETEAVTAVGGGFDLITSKNTLKNGYLHPERSVDERLLVHLGVPEADFVGALFKALKPGGLVVIYNISPAPAKETEPYKPWADGRCPFPQEMWTGAGFELLSFDADDNAAARAIFRALDYPTETEDGKPDIFAHYTIAQRPK